MVSIKTNPVQSVLTVFSTIIRNIEFIDKKFSILSKAILRVGKLY